MFPSNQTYVVLKHKMAQSMGSLAGQFDKYSREGVLHERAGEKMS